MAGLCEFQPAEAERLLRRRRGDTRPAGDRRRHLRSSIRASGPIRELAIIQKIGRLLQIEAHFYVLYGVES